MKKTTILGLMIGIPVFWLALIWIGAIWDMIDHILVNKLTATLFIILLVNIIIYKFLISDDKPGEKFVDKR